MVHSPVINPDKFIDTTNPRYNDAENILHWLLKYQGGGDYTYVAIEKATGIPGTTVREFLVPEVWAWRPYSYLKNLRENKKRAYDYYIANSKEHGTEKPDRGEGCKINISKFQYMEFVAALHNCKMVYVEDENKYVAHQMTDDEANKDVIAKLREMDQDFNHL